MVLSLEQIHELEINERYPDAIDALEERLDKDPHDPETIIRLGFNLWYAAEEADRMGISLPEQEYYERVMELLEEYKSELHDNADFCHAFGLGISLFPYYFPGGSQELGDSLLSRAAELDDFYASFMRQAPRWYNLVPRFVRRLLGTDWVERNNRRTADRFRGRGIFAAYYNIAGIDKYTG